MKNKNKKLHLFLLLTLFLGIYIDIINCLNGTNSNKNSDSIKIHAIDYNNVTIISDNISNWNYGNSLDPSIAISNSGVIHVVWEDFTDHDDYGGNEILYSSNDGSGWSNPIIISDNSSNWNNDFSGCPSIAVDNLGGIHVVWEDGTPGAWGIDMEIMYTSSTDGIIWSNVIVLSDNSTHWNDSYSGAPSIAIDSNGIIHVVWEDYTEGVWTGGTFDSEIMYRFNDGSGWSNVTVISDDINLIGISWNPSISIDNLDSLHVVWEDDSNGDWADDEILYSFNDGSGWTDAVLISDDATQWNTGYSNYPDIAIDNTGKIHVVWFDGTDGAWGSDSEIMYVTNNGTGWSNVTILSDDKTHWNIGASHYPSIAIDDNDKIHVVWHDETNGIWGTDNEIMYTYFNGSKWSKIAIISDNVTHWNTGYSNYPDIAIDNSGGIHVVWEDGTTGVWGTDYEIMHSISKGYIPEYYTSKDISNDKGISFGHTFLLIVIIGIGTIFGQMLRKYRQRLFKIYY